jgi:pectate lyase
MSAEIYVENNVFSSVKNAVFTDDDGAVNQSGNTYTNSTTAITRTTSFKPSYSYSAEAASTVAASVSAGAGTGKVG